MSNQPIENAPRPPQEKPPSRSALALDEALRLGWITVDFERGIVLTLRRRWQEGIPSPLRVKANKDGYTWFRLWYYGWYAWVFVHRAVWVAANGSVPAGFEIDHINRDRADNRLSNLRLLTHARNVPRGRHASRVNSAKWKASRKLTIGQADEIRRRWAAGGESQSAIGADYGIDRKYMSDIVRVKAWNVSKWHGLADGPEVP